MSRLDQSSRPRSRVQARPSTALAAHAAFYGAVAFAAACVIGLVN
jgi:hypothetical protein